MRSLRSLAPLIALLFAAAGQAAPARASNPATVWNLTANWCRFPLQANPCPAPAGASWSYYQGMTLHTPSSYALLPRYARHFCLVKGLEVWTGTDFVNTDAPLPEVGLNVTPTSKTCLSLTWPSHVIIVHPDNPLFVVIGWQSPVTGTATVSGSISDADSGGGDGVRWWLDQGSTTLSSGSVFNTTQTISTSTSVAVGDYLYLIVDPGASGDISYDSTGIRLNISA